MATSIQEALEAYDREHAFARSVLLPEEDRAKLTAARWEGGYRWFRTRNVVCLEKAQRLRVASEILERAAIPPAWCSNRFFTRSLAFVARLRRRQNLRLVRGGFAQI